MNNIEIRIGDIGFVMTFNAKKLGETRDLSGLNACLLQAKGQTDRALTVASAALGMLTYTTLAADWTAGGFIKAGAYEATILFANSGGTIRILGEPFTITVKGAFEE